jgi:dienelactone hydrolase
MKAKIVTESIAYEHAGVSLEGYLAYPAAAGRSQRPGVVLVPEWWGLNDYMRGRARQLAELGYVAFALDMYGAGLVTTDAKQAEAWAGAFYGKPIMAERARAGLGQLLKTGRVQRARVAAIGYCFGGTTVQALAYSGAPLAGAASFHGGLIPASAAAARQNRAKFLICHGGADAFESKAEVEAFLEAMKAGKFDYQFIIYSSAIHAFTNPAADRMAKLNHLEGGIGYNRAADRRSWAHLRLFLSEVLDGQKP